MAPAPSPRAVRFFRSAADFRRWLERHHATADELWVGYHKKGTGTPSIDWPQSVDEALCFGWIDGIRRSLGEESYTIRFTPRRPGSVWSLVNVRKAEAAIAAGRMHAAGLAAFEARTAKGTGIYAFEHEDASAHAAEAEATLRANAAAWRFWSAQPPGYRKTALHWVTSAKRADTRARRLATLVEDSAAGRRIGLLRREG
jgi:uncharacterized protein YdeI (YjbR/CyaY-like superfamily)